MNMHIPQSWQTFTELEQICLVPQNIISPGTSKPSIDVTQDTLIGAYLLTIQNSKLRKDQMQNLMMFMGKYNGYLPEPAGYEYEQPYWTGRQLYSLILPDISINQLKTVKIIRGQLTEGYLNDESLGSSPAGLIKQIYNAYGMNACSDFLNNTQKLITRWMMDNSFTISFGDACIAKEQRKNIKEFTNKYLNDTFDVIKKAQHGVFANDLDESYISSKLDFEITKILSNLTEKVKDYIFETISKSNGFYISGSKGSGSKGSASHTTQTLGIVGQQDIWGSRISEGFTERTLPHFSRNDMGPDAKGFCRNSFIEGLSPSEMFFHAMGGRTGTIDTAIKTADSGYLSRKFIKATEDLMINYDMTVRNSSGYIVQFGYGDDNLDPVKLEKISRIEIFEYDNKKMEEQYKFDSFDQSYFETFMTPEAIKEMMIDDSYKSLLNDEYEQIFNMRNELRYNFFDKVQAIGDVSTYIPINLYRVIPSQLIKFNIQPFNLTDLTPKYIIESYNEAMKDIVKYLPEKDYNWKLFKIIFKSFLATKKVMKEYRMSKATYDSIILLIKEKMLGALVSPGEMVGVIGAQTLGEISTQLTLNSVTYETEIIVRDFDKKIKKYQIGDFIEREIKKSEKIDYMEDKDTTYAECKNYLEIPSCDEDGNVTWKRIEAVTKHPVINKDGSNTMLKITTEDEREVTVTKAKSLLKLVNGKIVPVDGDCLKVGDYLPVSTKQIDFEETYKLNLKEILPPNEYVYGSELEKAKSVMDEHQWWKKYANKLFTLPHKRSDSVVQLASDRVRPGRKTKNTIHNGFVYMLTSNYTDYRIPEVIDLDYNFGYLIGAYMAEGCMTNHQVSIANNDAEYLRPIQELCEKFNVTTKIYKHENKGKEGWTSQDIRIYSTILCDILEKLCGKLSHNKFLSDKIIFSNKECLKGILDAYIGGDGCIRKSDISMGSTSKNMLIDVQNILLIFNIYSHIHKPPLQQSNNRGSEDIKQMYRLCVYGEQSKKLASLLNMKIGYKKDTLHELLNHDHLFTYAKKYELMPNEINGEIVMEDRNNRFIDLVFDKIKSIEEVSNTTNYAYDLTINETKNFNIFNGVCCHDTFHLAGVGAGSLVITQGIPRLREIINVSKKLKSKNMIIYLKDQYSLDKNEARKVQSKFVYTQLKDMIAKSEIIYDNKYGETDKVEDREFIKSYKEFTQLFDIDDIDETTLSPWILRLTFDKESLMNRKVRVQEIQETIKQNFHNDQEIECIFSDDSVNDVVMRIRIKQDGKGNFLDFIKDFEKQLIELSLRGITDISQVEITESNIVKYNNEGAMEAKKEWVLKTSGSNILDVMSDDAVDITRTITNDILEFYEVFGIEATRELIYRELYKVYAEKHPNPRHIQMMADVMTYRGNKIMQIDRHGLNKNSEIGPIAKACFEEVMNIFTKAAVFAEKDNMKGVSANILAGQFCKSGTNAFDLLIDEDKLLEEINIPDYHETEMVKIDEKDIDKAFDNTFKYNSKLSKVEDIDDSDFTFGFGMEQSKQFVLDENIDNKNINIVLVEKNNVVVSNNLEQSQNNIFDKIDIEPVQEYNKEIETKEKEELKEDSEDINFGNINIEEPEYDKTEDDIETKIETKPKKLRVKKENKVTEEKDEKPKKNDKPIKLKITKKK